MLLRNPKTAEIVGLCFGDGSLTQRNSGKDLGKLRFQLRGNITEDRDHYNHHIIPLFERVFKIRINPIEDKSKTESYGLAIEIQRVCNLLIKLGVPLGIKRELIIPSWITKNDEFLKCFIRGYMDTDGSIYCGKDYNYPEKGYIKLRMSISSISINLIKEVSHSLKRLQVHNLVIKSYTPKDKRQKKFSKLQIDGPNVVDYFSKIGTKSSKHFTKYQVWQRFGFCPPYTTLKQRQIALLRNNFAIQTAGVPEPGQTG